MRSTNYLAALVLFLMPAISVELLSGNTPLAIYLNPMTFVTLNVVYGGALLLIRETVVRWGKGFASMLVLATGYGMVNEALGSKGFFDPHFYSAVEFRLEGFGRWFGINVPWALDISIFHAVFSILVPLVIVSAIFTGNERWIGNKLYAALLIALVAVTAFVFKHFSLPPYYYHYNEGLGPISLIIALLALAILAAWKMPAIAFAKWRIRLNALALFFIGAVYLLAYVILPNIVRTVTNSPPLYESFLLVFFVALPILLVLKLPEPTGRGKVALAAGLLAPVIAQSAANSRLIPAAIVLALIVIAWLRSAPTGTW